MDHKEDKKNPSYTEVAILAYLAFPVRSYYTEDGYQTLAVLEDETPDNYLPRWKAKKKNPKNLVGNTTVVIELISVLKSQVHFDQPSVHWTNQRSCMNFELFQAVKDYKVVIQRSIK